MTFFPCAVSFTNLITEVNDRNETVYAAKAQQTVTKPVRSPPQAALSQRGRLCPQPSP